MKDKRQQEAESKSPLTKICGLISKTCNFFKEDVWLKDMAESPALLRYPLTLLRIILIVLRGFSQDNCTLQASALTYITLVSLVPILAIMFSFTKGMGMQHKLFSAVGVERYEIQNVNDGQITYDYRIIDESAIQNASSSTAANEQLLTAGIAAKLPLPMQEAILKIFKYVENTNFTALGLVGSIMLLFTVIFSMAKLEKSFNLIWGVRHQRTFLRKCSEYLILIILFPIIFLFTTSMNSLLFSNRAVQYLQMHYGHVAYMLNISVKLFCLLILLCAFSLFFMYMPNTKVKAIPAFVAGLLSFILWGAVQWAYMKLQIGLTNFNSIYGTFAVVPFFLAWLYANWSIILLGGEISFAVQNHRTIHLEKSGEHAGIGICIAIGQLLLYEICCNFHQGKGATHAEDFANAHNIPSRILQFVLDQMTKSGIIIKTSDDACAKYLPGKEICALSPADVEESFRQQTSLETRSYIRDLPEMLRKEYEQTYTDFSAKLKHLTFDKLVAAK